MDISNINIDSITPYPNNAKEHPQAQVEDIARSIERYGFVQPIVINGNNEIIIGHGRYLAAKNLQLEKVPVVRVDYLTDEQIRELRILDNKLNESDWNIELLLNEIENYDLDFEIFESINFDNMVNTEYEAPDLSGLYEDAEEKEVQPKTIKCPHCGGLIEL